MDDSNISLNRTDLLTLTKLLKKFNPGDPVAFAMGWSACVEAIEAVAQTMPDNCVLVDKDEYDMKIRLLD